MPRSVGNPEGVTVGPTRRVTLREAAEILGVSKEAVRKRVIRGSLPSETGADGRRYVYLPAGGDAAPTREPDALTSERLERIAFLERELERRAEEAAELRRIIAGLVQRVPALEAPPEAPEPPTSGAGPNTQTPPPAERPSFWRILLGR